MDKYANAKLISGIMMRGSPSFLSKDSEMQNIMVSNFASRTRSRKFGGTGIGNGAFGLDSSQSFLNSKFSLNNP